MKTKIKYRLVAVKFNDMLHAMMDHAGVPDNLETRKAVCDVLCDLKLATWKKVRNAGERDGDYDLVYIETIEFDEDEIQDYFGRERITAPTLKSTEVGKNNHEKCQKKKAGRKDTDKRSHPV